MRRRRLSYFSRIYAFIWRNRSVKTTFSFAGRNIFKGRFYQNVKRNQPEIKNLCVFARHALPDLLNFPHLLGVWVGDKRHFEPYTFDDDIVSIYFRKYILMLCCINHHITATRDFQESMTKISRQTEGEPRPKTTSKEGT